MNAEAQPTSNKHPVFKTVNDVTARCLQFKGTTHDNQYRLVAAVSNPLLMTKTNDEFNRCRDGDGGRGGGLLISVLYGAECPWIIPCYDTCSEILEWEVGERFHGSPPSILTANIVGHRTAGMTLKQRFCRHVLVVTAHIFTSIQVNQQLNIHANTAHVRKQTGLARQTARNNHYRDANCTRTTTPKSDYSYTLFTHNVRRHEWPRLLSIPTSIYFKHTKVENIFRISLVQEIYTTPV
jgi:hypothetical protein